MTTFNDHEFVNSPPSAPIHPAPAPAKPKVDVEARNEARAEQAKKQAAHNPNDARTNRFADQSPADFAQFYKFVWRRQPGLVLQFNHERHAK